MALVECKYCRSQVSDQALSCPHCGKDPKLDPRQLATERKNRWKKIWKGVVFGFLGLITLLGASTLLLMVSCSGYNNSEKAHDDSARIADSIAQVEAAKAAAERAYLDSLRQDSIMQKQIDEEYKNGLVLESSKSKYRYIGDCTVAGEFRRDCQIINNTSIVLSEEDYQINYKYEDLDTVDGELWPVTKNKSMKGKLLEPGETYDFVIKIIGDGLLKPTAKMKISKNEFERRFKEQTKYDPKNDKFVNINQ